jgi:hypothetical protein
MSFPPNFQPALALALATFIGSAVAAENANADRWSDPHDGIALQLRTKNVEMREDSKPNTDVKARLDCGLFLKNVGDKPKSLTVPSRRPGADNVGWEIKDSAGASWTPTFLPPPMPLPPGQKEATDTFELKPCDEVSYAQLHGISGFRNPADKQNTWYQVLPAGEYTIAAKLRIPGIDAEFTTNAVKLRVRAADEAVKGLKLMLEADAAETTVEGKKAKPVKLRLTFCNVGDKPLKLDTYDLVWWNLHFSISGPLVLTSERMVKREVRAAVAADFPTLEPNQKHVLEGIAFPGEVGWHVYDLRPPGQFSIRVSYVIPEDEDKSQPLQAGRWNGKVTSNEIRLLIKN